MRYIVTSVCGDTVNIPTYDIIECNEDELFEALDNRFGDWKTNDFIAIYEVGKKIEKPYAEKTLFTVKHPPHSLSRQKGYLLNCDLYQGNKKVGTFKTNAITGTIERNLAPVTARGLLHFFDLEGGKIADGGVEMLLEETATKTLIRIKGVVFKDYRWGEPVVTDMEALEMIVEEAGE